MQAKNVLYAAVGAPVVAARKVSDRVSTLKGRFTKETNTYTKKANETIDGWAGEGEKLVAGIREGKVVEEISQKVDLDQAKEQVSKLRDQLEDMLDTWRQSFRPEQATTTATPAPKTSAAKKPATKKPAAKKPVAKTSAAKKPAAKSSAAKTTTSSSAAKKSAAKSTASKASSAS
ncbi:MAG TPA: hypothetical protein VMP13_08700 [Acidimicrobiia bacterium]|nr:hypothetical protein [Acidimicrobiia bacterium]